MNTHLVTSMVWNSLAQPAGLPMVLAYLDPGVGSYAFQLLIAGFTALMFFFVQIRRKAGRWFGKLNHAGTQQAVDKRMTPESPVVAAATTQTSS